VTLRREVDNEARVREEARLNDEHTPYLNLATLTSDVVEPIVLGKSLAELQGDPLPHYAYGIYRVDEGLSLRFENIAADLAYHNLAQ
jgi:hypothetical protein